MSEQTITIGNKEFSVACQPGEEQYLQAAATMLDAEARTLLGQIGRLPAERMLLMAGLMLADKTAAAEDRLRVAENELSRLRAEVQSLRERPAPAPERVEVPVVSQEVIDAMSELAARAEAVADDIETRSKATS
ncbi:cell division protein ZapA [Rhodobacteraceae bacterium 2376]|uniref:Cell division protein ZapA n=1 Tax=Rhabdonatronobacter sediminivivens TaxID=2743469 RepID=A0A7Z0KW54_9RHOB|nr:cell division protein ZapA [Rhabdonatronobacter sediminivivens]NYS23420.1 cell division protein ZapA [Rhabdonatronobacter sediminivivens]